MENNNLKIINKKVLIVSAIVLAITFVLGLVLIFNVNNDFVITKTIWGKMISSLDVNTPGSGGFFILTLFGSFFTFLGELGILVVVSLMCFLIPVGVNSIILLINVIARLFQIGEERNWKNITTKLLLYFSVVLQGILNVYLLFLSLSGFSLLYIVIYLILIVNVGGFIKNIISLKDINN